MYANNNNYFVKHNLIFLPWRSEGYLMYVMYAVFLLCVV